MNLVTLSLSTSTGFAAQSISKPLGIRNHHRRVVFSGLERSSSAVRKEFVRLQRKTSAENVLECLFRPFIVAHSLVQKPRTKHATLPYLLRPTIGLLNLRLCLNQARYNTSYNGQHLNSYLPYRASLQNKPHQLQAFEEKVHQLLLFFQGKDAHNNLAPVHQLIKAGNRQYDPATCYTLAASIVELFHNRWEVVTRWMKQAEEPVVLTINNHLLSRIAGSASPEAIEINRPLFWETIASKAPLSVGIHEFIHVLTHTGQDVGTLLPDMSGQARVTFIQMRNHLFETFHRQSAPLKTFLSGRTLLGIRPYAFDAPTEFLPTTLECFMKQPARLCKTQEGQSIYNIYRDYFHFDPLQGYKDTDQNASPL